MRVLIGCTEMPTILAIINGSAMVHPSPILYPNTRRISQLLSVLLFRSEDERARTVWTTKEGYGVVAVWGQIGTVVNVAAPPFWASDRAQYFDETLRWASGRMPPVILAGDYELP